MGLRTPPLSKLLPRDSPSKGAGMWDTGWQRSGGLKGDLRMGLPWCLRQQRNLPAIQETWVRSLGEEDPLEKQMATHSSILAWKTPRTEEPGGLQSMGIKHDRVTDTFTDGETEAW